MSIPDRYAQTVRLLHGVALGWRSFGQVLAFRRLVPFIHIYALLRKFALVRMKVTFLGLANVGHGN